MQDRKKRGEEKCRRSKNTPLCLLRNSCDLSTPSSQIRQHGRNDKSRRFRIVPSHAHLGKIDGIVTTTLGISQKSISHVDLEIGPDVQQLLLMSIPPHRLTDGGRVGKSVDPANHMTEQIIRDGTCQIDDTTVSGLYKGSSEPLIPSITTSGARACRLDFLGPRQNSSFTRPEISSMPFFSARFPGSLGRDSGSGLWSQ